MNRRLLLATSSIPWLSILGACDREVNPNFAAPSPSPEVLEIKAQDERVTKRFGLGRRGHESLVDAMDGKEFNDLEIFYFNTSIAYYQKAGQKLSNRGRSAMSSPPPEKLRVIWRDRYEKMWDKSNMLVSAGKIIGEEVIEVASRIPQTLLDDLRRDPKGNLRIKIRLHREGVLLGWDIERRPGFDPKKRDSFGEIAYVSPGWVKTGGDFKEARGVYWLEDGSGNLVRAPRPETLGGVMPPELARRGIVFNQHGFLREKGWYVHPKTGERIETDF